MVVYLRSMAVIAVHFASFAFATEISPMQKSAAKTHTHTPACCCADDHKLWLADDLRLQSPPPSQRKSQPPNIKLQYAAAKAARQLQRLQLQRLRKAILQPVPPNSPQVPGRDDCKTDVAGDKNKEDTVSIEKEIKKKPEKAVNSKRKNSNFSQEPLKRKKTKRDDN